MKKHIYSVTYDIKMNRKQTAHEVYVEADTAKEARAAFDEWHEYHKYDREVRHPFHINVRRVKDDEILDYYTYTIIAK